MIHTKQKWQQNHEYEVNNLSNRLGLERQLSKLLGEYQVTFEEGDELGQQVDAMLEAIDANIPETEKEYAALSDETFETSEAEQRYQDWKGRRHED